MPVNIGPYSQDALTHIINVQWGGAPKFVYGTLTDNALYCVAIGSAGSIDQQTIVPPGPGDPRFGLSAFGSSYNLITKNAGLPNETRTPVFLICGNRSELVAVDDGAGNEIHLPQYFTLIYSSNDGINWEIVRQQDGGIPSLPHPSDAANPAALVWDKDGNAFFYDQNHELTDQIFRSMDGSSWSEVSSTATEGADPDTYMSAFPMHCSGNDCVDDRGQHVPDGVMSAPGAITAKPVKPPIINYAAGTSTVSFASGDPSETWGSGRIQVTLATDGAPVTTTVSVPGVPKVFCVAVAGGVIMAGGAADIAGETGAVAISFDLGVTWKAVASRDSPVTTMVANARL